MARHPFGAAVSDPRLADTANAVLERFGTAVDACIAAFLMASALDPGVLLGAATVLTAGPGVGARGFDGPLLQPGKGAPRPRGFQRDEDIRPAARVCVSAALAALYASHAHDGSLSLTELAAPAVKAASAAGAKGRAALLKRVGAGGHLAVRDHNFVRDLVEVAGRVVGGCVTDTDLEDATATVAPPERSRHLLRVASPMRVPSTVPLDGFAVCACDSRGVIAVLHALHDPDGVVVPTREVTASRAAVPVLRGVPRVTPGTAIGPRAPVALLADDTGVVWSGIAFDAAVEVSLDDLDVDRADGITIEQTLRRAIDAQSGGVRGACAVVRATVSGGLVRALVLAR